MGVIGDNAALLNDAYKVWKEQQGLRNLGARDLYKKYIAPSYTLLREVHTDYLELYLELEERVAENWSSPADTVKWFARKRVRRQTDRSELSLLRFPRVTGESRGRDIDAATEEYLNEVRSYFLPGQPPKLSKDRLYKNVEPDSRSTVTEDLIRLASIWRRLSPQDQRVLLAEEYHDSHFMVTNRFAHSELIQRIMEASITSYAVPGAEMSVWDLNDLIPQRAINSTPHGYKQVSWHQIAKDYSTGQHWWQKALEVRADHEKFFGGNHEKLRIAEGAMLAEVISSHARQQRESLELAMRKVQVAYMKIRIMAEP